MSLKQWGEHIATAYSKKNAKELVRQCNVALAIMPLTHDEKMAIEFHFKHIAGHVKGKEVYYIYAKHLPKKWQSAFK